MGKLCLQASSFIFYRIFITLAGNQDRHKISDEFEFRPDRISHFGVICPWGRIKFSIDIVWNLQVQLTFQTLEFFVTLFLGTVRPRRLKLGTHVGSGQMYHVYWNQATAAYSSLYFFIFLSNFQHWNFSSHFSRELWGIEDWKLVHMWTVGRCIMYTGIRLPLLIFPFISSFFFLSNFQHWNFSSHFSQEVWGLEDWNLVHTWTVGRCIVYTGIRLLLLIRPFISSFFYLSNFQMLKFFVTLFSETVRPRRLKLGTDVDSGQMYCVYRNQAAAAYSSLYFFNFLSLQLSNIKIFCHIFSSPEPKAHKVSL